MNTNLTFKALLVALVLGMTACASMSGGASNDKYQPSYLQSHLIQGQTTKAEVIAMFGEPKSKSISSDKSEYWYYSFNQSHSPLGALASSSSQTVNTGISILKNRLMQAIPNGGSGEVGAMVQSAKVDAANAATGTDNANKSENLQIRFDRNGRVERFNLSQ
ncbi:hypothetical protein F889_00210 [Acinetobacter colistiniresistens]|uniref:Outer membrane protein assembly factor BamE n=2 Tax=Acinetobacter TaxID=469 RepID=N9R2G2_9GAMM|nr:MULTISPECIES: hypothetical protein [Acinetobacter]ENX36496.1 hypothetical protein F889_00210 [Acinetobacter colistiniresistens]MCI3879932.1 hypothetical protein [Acinetobacter higginsii]MDO3656868.1 hypothetical protein [Acinetobacter genomosp. 15BJ]